MGHVRDLPASSKALPERYRKEPWAYLGVNIDEGFEPVYVPAKSRNEQIKKLKSLVKDATELYLATDEDREGESIAWHLTEILKPKIPVKRMVFHEITESAIRDAFANPRDIDLRLVEAQETRRVLDRLVGYDVSRVLWLKVSKGLSAGRVQSVAVRIVVERERERIAFRSASYWDITGVFSRTGEEHEFEGRLVSIDGRRVASGRDFASDGTQQGEALLLNEDSASELVDTLSDSHFSVESTETKPYTRRPYPPFRTSTLQQEAGRRLRFSTSRTMSAAQRLYENGYITYMRTDSVTVASSAITTARAQISELFGSEYLPSKPRVYLSKAKNAQEAHEAIRPAGETWKTPAQVAREVNRDEAALYELIWQRMLASQMPDASGESLSAVISGTASDLRVVRFSATGRTISFPGFLKAYGSGFADDGDEKQPPLPQLQSEDALTVRSITANGHETKPPSRLTEATLIQRMEELGVGRPSTYASIMTRIQDAGYVFKKGQALVPTFTAFAVTNLLEQAFPNLVDYAFTARMENDLDRIAGGEEERIPWLTRFYLGDQGLKELIESKLGEIDARSINSFPIGVDEHGRSIVARVGKYGPFVEREEDRGSIPDDLAPDELTVEKATELIDSQSRGDKILGTDPESGLTVLARNGRFGPYVQLGDQQEDSKEKPKRASLLKTMDLDSLSLDDALKLLSLPRLVGNDENGVPIEAFNGRYGPYIQRGEDRRSLASEEELFTVDEASALKLLAEPPRRRGQQRSSQAPIRELGEDPVSGNPVTLRTGRFGPYVTDTVVNASLRKSDSVETITIERAAELLQARRDRMES